MDMEWGVGTEVEGGRQELQMFKLWIKSLYNLCWLLCFENTSLLFNSTYTRYGMSFKKRPTAPRDKNITDIPCKQHEHSLNIELCNIRSIGNKLNLVSTYLRSQQRPDLLFLTETWLKPKFQMSCPDGYNVLRCDRGEHKQGGGVLLLYKTELQVNQVTVDVDSTVGHFDILCVDVYSNDNLTRFCCVYNPPCQDNSAVLYLCNILQNVLVSKTPLFILGDFNFPNINWKIPSSFGDLAHSSFFNFCFQLILPMRLRNHISHASILSIRALVSVHVSHPYSIMEKT